MAEFHVDQQPGATDSDKLGAACVAALKAIPSTVVLPDRELRMTRYQNVRQGVSVRGYGSTRSTVLLDYPGAAAPAGNAPYGFQVAPYLDMTRITVLSDFGIRGRPTGFYRLLVGFNTAGLFDLRDLDFGVCGQSFVELRGCNHVSLFNCTGKYGGDNSWDGGSAKYKIAMVDCDDVILESCELGDPTHDRNQSFVTVNHSTNVAVRDSTFHGTRTYCLNTHGTDSSDVFFERNTLAPGPNAKFGAVLVGNEYYGPDRDVYLRNNTMLGVKVFCELRAGSEAHMSGNTVPPCNDLIRFGPGGGKVTVTP